MKRKKLVHKVEKIVHEEVSRDFGEYYGDNFSREPHPEQSEYVAVSVVYEGDLSDAPLGWRTGVSLRVQDRLYEEGMKVYAFIDYVTKSKWQSGEWQPPRSWGEW